MSQNNQPIPLSAFLNVIEHSLDQIFGDRQFWVIAETTDVKIYKERGYAFLTLVEKVDEVVVASVGAAIWRNNIHKVWQFEKITGTSFSKNLKLALQVSLSYSAKFGLRLIIHEIDASFTLGQISQQRDLVLRELCEKHPQWVWFGDGKYQSANQRVKLPKVIQRIALIAANGSDGFRDFMHELQNNPYKIGFNVTLFDVQVQGDLATSAISKAIDLAACHKEFDAIVLVRGGGSQVDFTAFDSLEVSLSVAKSQLPVFTGIGHERNVSIADELANSPLKTPTKCANHLVELAIEFMAWIQFSKQELIQKVERFLSLKTQYNQQLLSQFVRAAQFNISQRTQILINIKSQMNLLNPTNTLNRGYALIRKNSIIVESIQHLQPLESIQIQLKDGMADVIVQKIQKN